MLLTEKRTRVVCHLPFQHSAHELAFSRIVAYVRSLKDEGIGLEGYTLSPCTGNWWSRERQKWDRDPQLLLTLDYLIDIDDPDHHLLASIEQLVQTIEISYRQCKCPEDEFWVVSESLTRYFRSKRRRAPNLPASITTPSVKD